MGGLCLAEIRLPPPPLHTKKCIDRKREREGFIFDVGLNFLMHFCPRGREGSKN